MYKQEEMFSADVSAHVDRITILAKAINGDETTVYKAIMASPGLIRTGDAKWPYRHSFYFNDGAYISIRGFDAKVPFFRLDFNPAKLTEETTYSIIPILKTVTRPRLSRLDIAIDYIGVDLALVEWVENRSRKRREYRNPRGRLETLYLGAFSSDNLIRIYDKAVEAGLGEQLETSGVQVWRVEAQMRVRPDGHVWSKNPFAGLKGQARAAPPGSMDIREFAVVQLLQRDPGYMDELSPRSRTKYRKLLKELAEYYNIEPTPAEIWKKEKASLQQQVATWMREFGK